MTKEVLRKYWRIVICIMKVVIEDLTRKKSDVSYNGSVSIDIGSGLFRDLNSLYLIH